MKKRILLIAVLAVFCLLLLSMPLAAGADSSGTCGANLTWTLDGNGKLTISGTGSMSFSSTDDIPPWDSFKSSILSVEITSGVTSIATGAFSYCRNLTSVSIPGTVTQIGASAFSSTGLTSITIPDSVTSIGYSAFECCGSLTGVSLPSGISTIPLRLFGTCGQLSSIVIPDGVTMIYGNAFENCTGLETVTLPDSLTEIADSAFYSCSNISTVRYTGSQDSWDSILIGRNNEHLSDASITYNYTAPTIVDSGTCGDNLTWTVDYDGLLTISGSGEMYNYTQSEAAPWGTGITGVSIGEGVASIGHYAFCNCVGLTNVTIPGNVASIGNYSFAWCSNLDNLELCEGVRTIGEYAFNGTGVLQITLPNSLSNITGRSFSTPASGSYKIKLIAHLNSNAAKYVCKFKDYQGMRNIFYDPDYPGCAFSYIWEDDEITNLDLCFGSCDQETLVIPEGVTRLGGEYSENSSRGCYANNKTIKTVVLPAGIRYIGRRAFEGCTNLTSINLRDTITYIGGNAFFDCVNLEGLTLPSNLSNIESQTFYNCSSLTVVDIPDTVSSIGSSAFGGCSGLTSISIPEGVSTIKGSTFSGCTNLRSIGIPCSLTNIEGQAFGNCDNLTDVYYGGTQTKWSAVKIGYSNGCLTGATIHFNDIPGTTIYASGTCGEGLTWTVDYDGLLTISGSGEMYNYTQSEAAPWGTGITGVSIGEGVTSIGHYAFYYCQGLTHVTIPGNVASIGNYSFAWCSNLDSLELCEGVSTIGEYAFNGDSGLRITLPNSLSNITDKSFSTPSSGSGSIKLIAHLNSNAAKYVCKFKDYQGMRNMFYDPDYPGCAFSYIWQGNEITDLDLCFGSCDQETLVIPEGVTRLGGEYSENSSRGCYANNKTIKTVVLPAGIRYIGRRAFEGCTNLTSINLRDTITYIGGNAFFDCVNLEGLTLPSNLSNIESQTFYNCSSLTVVDIPDTVSSIGSSAFYNCNGLTSISIPEGITTISNSTFRECTSLANISIPFSIASIDGYAFQNCVNLSEVYYGGTLTKWNSTVIGNGNGCLTDAQLYYTTLSGHLITLIDSTPATCITEGNISCWYCYTCGKHYSDENAEYEIIDDGWVIPADGHTLTEHQAVEETCTTAGNSAYWTCSTCGKNFSDEDAEDEIAAESWIIPATGHTLTEHPAVEETCTTAGNSAYWSCSVCGKYFSDEDAEHEIAADSWIIPAAGHTLTEHPAVEETCTTAGNSAYWSCSVCGEYFSDEDAEHEIAADSWIIPAAGHTLTAHPAVEATCTTAGNSAYWTCSVCGKYFSGEDAEDEIAQDSWVIPAAGHTLTEHQAVDETCTTAGNSAYWSCSVCGKYFLDEDAEDEIAADSWVIQAAGHTLTAHQAVGETCTTAGNSAYWSCSVCGKYFSDEDAEHEITENSWVIEATGHDWNIAVYEWSDDHSAVTATRTCRNDASHTETETVDTTSQVTTPATCEETGVAIYTSAVFGNEAFTAQTKTVDTPALGHDWGEYTFAWSGEQSTLLKTRVCRRDSSHTETTGADITDSGSCGTGVSWTLYENGWLYITGSGPMDDYHVEYDTASNTYTTTAPWAQYANQITRIYIPGNVTCIGDFAFRYCSGVTEAVLPDCVTRIGDFAFSRCSSLTAITLPLNLVSIGSDAFSYCQSLGEIIIPDLVTSIGEEAFIYCENLVSANLPEGITVIDESTFDSCYLLANVTIPSTVVEIADSAFYHCSLTSVDIPEGVTSIGESAFAECASLSSVTIPGSVTSIGMGAFFGCQSLSEVYYDEVQERWNAISVGRNNEALALANLHFHEHIWGEAAYVWADDLSTVTASHVCETNPDHTETETVGVTAQVTKPATCEEAGETTYTSASFRKAGFTVQTRTLENVPALGHNWGAPVYEWNEDNTQVTATRVCARDAAHTETETVNATQQVTKEPTCEEPGETTYTSEAFENEEFTVQTKTLTNVDALGHAWGEVAYTWAEDNSSVTATRVCTNDAEHVETETVSVTVEITKQPTCEEMGETTYTSAAFENEVFAIQTKTLTNVDAIGHAWGEVTYTWAEDNSAVTATRVCANDAEHVETETVNVTAEITLQATCEEMGETTYTSAAFENEAFTAQTKTADIPAAGHSWGAPVYEWSDDHTQVTATRVCARDITHIETETVSATYRVTASPAETVPGAYNWISAEFENSAFSVQETEDMGIRALGSMNVLYLPASLTRIESEAFSGINAEAVIVPDGCTTIEPMAFVNCQNLCYIRIPAGVEIPEDAFSGCPKVIVDQQRE